MASRWVDGGGAVLAGVGLVGALGYDAPTALAAARAGLSRAGVQSHWRQRSGVTGLDEPIAGHAAHLLTDGFEGEVRLRRLALAALADLMGGRWDTAPLHGKVGLYLALPDPERGRSCAALQPGPPPEADPDLPPASERVRALAQSVAAGVAWPRAPASLFWNHSGHTAGPVALGAALRDLAAATVDTAVVLAVDSLLDEDALSWLAACGRLKCDESPAGLMPGEAAVALALCRPGQVAAPGAHVQGLCFAEEPLSQAEAQVSTGEVLAATLARAWQQSQAPGVAAWLLSDHNGEHARAFELGSAMARLRGEDDAFAQPAVWLPALSFGDTGAASAALAMAMASHAWQRRCAPAAHALVASASDGSPRAAVLLSSG